MSSRASIDAAGCDHATPIPTASRIGPLLASSVVVPFKVGTRDVPTDLEAQVGNVFVRVGLILAEAGGSWDDVVRMTFFVTGPGSRDAIDPAWTARFPDPAHRPARHTQVATLPAGMEVQCEFLAYVST